VRRVASNEFNRGINLALAFAAILMSSIIDVYHDGNRFSTHARSLRNSMNIVYCAPEARTHQNCLPRFSRPVTFLVLRLYFESGGIGDGGLLQTSCGTDPLYDLYGPRGPNFLLAAPVHACHRRQVLWPFE